MRQILRLAAVLAGVLVLQLMPPARAEDVSDCHRGADAFLNDELAVAIEAYTDCISTGDLSIATLAVAYSNRGIAWANLGEYQKAIDDYDQAIRIDPDNIAPYSNRGLAWYYLGEYQKAIDDHDQAIRIDPNYAIAYNNRGIAWAGLSEYWKAIDDYDHAIRLDPDSADAYYNRGMAWYHLGEYQRSIGEVDQVIRINPESADAYANRGLLWRRLGEYQEAIDDYDKAIQLDSDLAFAYRGLALTLYEAGSDLERARASAEKAIGLKDDEASYHGTLAHVLAAQGHRSEALAEFERAIRLGGIDRVRGYQEVLTEQGYYTGAIDGAYDPATRAALIACIAVACNLSGS